MYLCYYRIIKKNVEDTLQSTLVHLADIHGTSPTTKKEKEKNIKRGLLRPLLVQQQNDMQVS